MQPSKHHIDDGAVNDQPLKKMKLDFLVHGMPPAPQPAATPSQPQKMKLDFLVHDMASNQHAVTLPPPVPSVHFSQPLTVDQDLQDRADAALDRMDAAVGLSMLSQAQVHQGSTPLAGFVDEDVGDAARILQQMASDEGGVSPMQLDEDIPSAPEHASVQQQPTYDRVEGAFALLMLARDWADPNASGFDHFIDENTYNANRARQQSVSEDSQATISAQSSQSSSQFQHDSSVGEQVVISADDTFPRGDGDDQVYQPPSDMDHNDILHHHDQLWLNDLQPGEIIRPEFVPSSANPNQPHRASPGDPRDDRIPSTDEEESQVTQTPPRPKRGKKAKAATTPRSTRKSKTGANAEVDDWQPPMPADDEDDGDFKVPAHVKRAMQNTQVTGLRWSWRNKKAPAIAQNQPPSSPTPSPSPSSSPAPTSLPSPPPTSRRGKAKKASSTAKKAPLVPDYSEGLMPSADNDFKFQYDSPSGLTAAQLDAALKIPARPKKFPLDLRNKDQMPVSYNQLHQMPKPGHAVEQVAKMEKAHAKEVKGWDDADTEDEL